MPFAGDDYIAHALRYGDPLARAAIVFIHSLELTYKNPEEYPSEWKIMRLQNGNKCILLFASTAKHHFS